MTSLRKRVTSYFRQLSFHNESRERKSAIHDNSFVTKYLTGQIKVREGPPVVYGKGPNDLPNFEVDRYSTGTNSIVGCSTGPNGGLTTVTRLEKHLVMPDSDIDFIDTEDDANVDGSKHKSGAVVVRRSQLQPLDNSTMVIKVAGQQYSVTNTTTTTTTSATNRNRNSRSLTNLTDLNSPDDTHHHLPNNNNEHEAHCSQQSQIKYLTSEVSQTCQNNIPISSDIPTGTKNDGVKQSSQRDNVNRPYSISKSKSENNPFEHRKQGKIIKLAERPKAYASNEDSAANSKLGNRSQLPPQWNKKTELVYGLSDSLYDMNQVTKCKNGNPIADCFGVIARNDSAILALADGVNWGEKACIAAKSAVHGCLHYLNKTIFDDTTLFEFDSSNMSDSTSQIYDNKNTPINTSHISPPKKDQGTPDNSENNENRINNTTEVFISILRAFNCAHNLILENDGMLTTLTVAVVLPLKQQGNVSSVSDVRDVSDVSDVSDKHRRYVCCVCNVGDTLAFVYSQRHGLREITQGSHDVHTNRDMRDALGALGPVDGIKPELNNLTLSVTTLDAGDIVLVASDGLTDNYDPTVCNFTVNTHIATEKTVQQQQRHSTPNREVKHRENRSHTPPKHRESAHMASRSNIKAASGKTDATKPSNIAPKAQTEHLEQDECQNPLIAQFMLDNALDNSNPNKNGLKADPHTDRDHANRAVRNKDLNRNSRFVPSKEPSSQKRSSLNNQTVISAKTKDNKSRREKDKMVNEKKVKTTLNPLAKSSSVSKCEYSNSKYKLLRSKTSVDIRPEVIARNEEGLPYVSPVQRYDITLLLIEDILKRGLSGKDKPCTTAKVLCENLLAYTMSITAAKRHTLEDNHLYFDEKNDILVEVSQKEKKLRRKKCLEKVQNLPGKLDHVSVVACNVGNVLFKPREYTTTNL